MSKKFAAIVAAALFGSYAVSASAVIIQTPPHRSSAQNECIKENPKDHQGYLACVHGKKEEKKNAASKNEDKSDGKPASAPASAPVDPINQPAPANK